MNPRWKTRALWALAAGAAGSAVTPAFADGNVSVTVSGATVTITGDTQDNSISFSLAGTGNTMLSISGSASTTVNSSFSGTSFDVSGVSSIVVAMSDGNDSVVIPSGLPLSSISLSVDLGANDDSFQFDNSGSGAAIASLAVNGGLGNDSISISGTVVSGNASIDAGDGGNVTNLSFLSISGNLSVGDNETAPAQAGNYLQLVSVGGTTRITSGFAGSYFQLVGCSFSGVVTYRGGDASDSFQSIGSQYSNGLDVQMGGGTDDFTSRTDFFGRPATVSGEAGNDQLNLFSGLVAPPKDSAAGDSSNAAVDLNGGQGDDAILVGGDRKGVRGGVPMGPRFTGRLLLQGGPGNDDLTVEDTVGTSLELRGFAGNDTVTLTRSTFTGSATLNGGNGRDVLYGVKGGANSLPKASKLYSFERSLPGSASATVQ